MLTQYEHHVALAQNKLCPFLLRTGNGLRDTVCNWHQNIEVFLIRGGTGHIRCGANDHALSTGDVVVVNTGTLHHIYSETGIDYDCLIIDELFCRENGIDTKIILFEEKICDPQTATLVHRVAEELRQYSADTPPERVAKIRCAVLMLLIELSENHRVTQIDTATRASNADEHVKAAISYLGEHYAEPISLDAVAAFVGVSKFHLSREFKKHTDQTIFTYLNTLRCRNAEISIRNGQTVTQAALENGFDSLSYFSRTYKRLMGTPPSSAT